MDLASGHVAALKKLKNTENLRFKVYNLGTGEASSVLDLVKTFEKVSGMKVPYVMKGRREGDIVSMYSDTTLATKDLGWVAQRNLMEMCEDFWRWQTMNPDGYKGESQANGNGIIEQNGKGVQKNGATHVNGDGIKATNGH